MMSKSILYNRQIRNFFGVKVHLFETKNCNTPPKLNPKMKMKSFVPKKSSLFCPDDKHRALEAGRCGNTSVPFENSAPNDQQAPDSSTRQLRQNSAISGSRLLKFLLLYWTISILLSANAEVSMCTLRLPTIEWTVAASARSFYRGRTPGGGGSRRSTTVPRHQNNVRNNISDDSES